VRARANAVAKALGASGAAVSGSVAIPAGEARKRLRAVERLYQAFHDLGADRRSVIIAVGGGTLTDVAGFAAATYLRGTRWLPVATTVLGMADAAIGGKTGVDFGGRKNLVGAFWQPVAAIGDLRALRTLPPAGRATGLAEVIKCAVIADPALLDLLGAWDVGALTPDRAAWQRAIAGAARVKARIVAADPHERGERALLNFGHTIGHAVEAASGFAVGHGDAVAAGMRAEGLIAQARGWWPKSDHARLLAALESARLPLYVPGVAEDAIWEALRADKKRIAGTARFVLPVRMGEVRHGLEVEEASVRAAIARVTQPPDSQEVRA